MPLDIPYQLTTCHIPKQLYNYPVCTLFSVWIHKDFPERDKQIYYRELAHMTMEAKKSLKICSQQAENPREQKM